MRSSTPITTWNSIRRSSRVCSLFFGSVKIAGVFGSERHRALVSREQAKLDRLLRKDPLRARRLLPRTIPQRLYDWRLRRERANPDPEAAALTVDDFILQERNVEEAFDLVAICRARANSSST
jgi:hypothetical protein